MQSSSRIRLWRGVPRGCLCASHRCYASAHASMGSSTAGPPGNRDARSRGDAGDNGPSPPSSSSSPPLVSAASSAPDESQRYRRRSSNPQTPREKAAFRRDYKYAKHRPLPDAPWRQLKTKTYLDDAERLYGRKETWHTVEDAVLREKLVAILQDYLRDTLAAARLEAREARKHHHLCSVAAKQYRAHVSSGAFGLVEGMQAWAREVLRGRTAAAADGHEDGGEEAIAAASLIAPDSDAVATAEGSAMAQSSSAVAVAADEKAAMEFREARRRRGERAVLTHTAAMADLPDADGRHAPASAFPFLRRRAIEDESTLDPSLVDWTAKYFPEDDTRTFAEPPKLRSHGRRANGGAHGVRGDWGESPPAGEGSGEGGSSGVDANDFDNGDTAAATGDVATASRSATRSSPGQVRAVHARHRLQRTLRDHENRHRATFDAEGVYYRVRRQSESDERAPKPQAVKASDLEPAGRRPEVVKVPWSVASKARAQGYSSDTLRAKERLIRLTRGENPETIP